MYGFSKSEIENNIDMGKINNGVFYGRQTRCVSPKFVNANPISMYSLAIEVINNFVIQNFKIYFKIFYVSIVD